MTAVSVQIVGALLVLSVLVTPAAAALRVSASPLLVPVLSTLFAVVAMVGGIMLALGGSVPISPYVTTISFLIYLACRAWGALQNRPAEVRAGRRQQPSVAPRSSIVIENLCRIVVPVTSCGTGGRNGGSRPATADAATRRYRRPALPHRPLPHRQPDPR